jgi:hypothetical protein
MIKQGLNLTTSSSDDPTQIIAALIPTADIHTGEVSKMNKNHVPI